MFKMLSQQQNAGKNRNIKITKRSFENMILFKYLGTKVTNQNLILKKI
jgi:hypothetical protein